MFLDNEVYDEIYVCAVRRQARSVRTYIGAINIYIDISSVGLAQATPNYMYAQNPCSSTIYVLFFARYSVNPQLCFQY